VAVQIQRRIRLRFPMQSILQPLRPLSTSANLPLSKVLASSQKSMPRAQEHWHEHR